MVGARGFEAPTSATPSWCGIRFNFDGKGTGSAAYDVVQSVQKVSSGSFKSLQGGIVQATRGYVHPRTADLCLPRKLSQCCRSIRMSFWTETEVATILAHVIGRTRRP